MTTRAIIEDAQVKLATDAATLAKAIETLQDCAAACTMCADACLAEEEVADLRDCITTCNVCAEICHATARAFARLTRGSYGILRAQADAAVEATRVCGEECRRHAEMHEHCRECAEACARAEDAARTLRDAVA